MIGFTDHRIDDYRIYHYLMKVYPLVLSSTLLTGDPDFAGGCLSPWWEVDGLESVLSWCPP